MSKEDGFGDLLTNIFLVRGFENIAFAVYDYQDRHSAAASRRDSEFYQRTKFVEPSVGQATVVEIAAAMLCDEAGLMACSLQAAEKSNAELWVFGSSEGMSSLEEVDRRLSADFTRSETGKRQAAVDQTSSARRSRRRVDEALCAAVRNALERCLLQRGYVRLGSELVGPQSDDRDSFAVVFDTSPTVDSVDAVCAKVQLRRCSYRGLTAEEVERMDGATVTVCPSGMKGTLSTSKSVGPALADNVVKRWQEADLLQTMTTSIGSSSNEDAADEEWAAVYVVTAGGVRAPFPRRALLVDAGQEAHNDADGGQQLPYPQNLGPDDPLANRTRKRPRTPPRGDPDCESQQQHDGAQLAAQNLDDVVDSSDIGGPFSETVELRGNELPYEGAAGSTGHSPVEADELNSRRRRPHRMLSEWSRDHFNAARRGGISGVYFPADAMQNFGRADSEASNRADPPSSGDENVPGDTMMDGRRDAKEAPKDRADGNHGGARAAAVSAKDRIPSTPIDCLSLSLAGAASLAREDGTREPSRGYQTPFLGPGAKEFSVDELKSALTLIEMQVIATAGMEEDSFGSTTDPEGRAEVLAAGTTRKELSALGKLLQSSIASRPWLQDPGVQLEVEGPLAVDSRALHVAVLESPQLCVGLRGDWVETSGSILPFWEKSGLQPYSGPKNVLFAVVASETLKDDARSFFRDVQTAYQECSLGEHQILPGERFFFVSDREERASDAHEESPERIRKIVDQFVGAISECVTHMNVIHDRRGDKNYVLYLVPPMGVSRGRQLSLFMRGMAGHLFRASSAGSDAPNYLIGGVHRVHIKLVPADALNCTSSAARDKNRWPLWTQIVKHYAFQTYNTIRNKHVPASADDAESVSAYRSGSVVGSPVTPEYINSGTIVIQPARQVQGTAGPIGDEGGAGAGAGAAASATLPLSETNGPSMLFEPAVVLATGPAGDAKEELVLHLCYQQNPTTRRYTYAWTNSRGEILDVTSLSYGEQAVTRNVRRVLFALMWQRGKRWYLPFATRTRLIVVKLGSLDESEAVDWDKVIGKILEESQQGTELAVTMRFPCGDDAVLADASSLEKSPGDAGKNNPGAELERKNAVNVVVGVDSVSVLELGDESLLQVFPIPSTDSSSSRYRDLVVSESCSAGSVASAWIVRSPGALRDSDRDEKALRLSLVRHFGIRDDKGRSAWDAASALEVVVGVAKNLYELSAVVTPPCWPMDAWQAKWPLHVQAVRAHSELTQLVLNGPTEGERTAPVAPGSAAT